MTTERVRTCPTCKKRIEGAPEELPSRPFCSRRCQLVDLDNWLSGTYRLSEPLPDDNGNLN